MYSDFVDKELIVNSNGNWTGGTCWPDTAGEWGRGITFWIISSTAHVSSNRFQWYRNSLFILDFMIFHDTQFSKDCQRENFVILGSVHDGLRVHNDGIHIIYPVGNALIVYDTRTNKQTILSGHSNTITCVEISPSGQLIASGQINHMGFKVWGAISCNIKILNFTEDRDYVHGVCTARTDVHICLAARTSVHTGVNCAHGCAYWCWLHAGVHKFLWARRRIKVLWSAICLLDTTRSQADHKQ